jgi:hypothetical protein
MSTPQEYILEIVYRNGEKDQHRAYTNLEEAVSAFEVSTGFSDPSEVLCEELVYYEDGDRHIVRGHEYEEEYELSDDEWDCSCPQPALCSGPCPEHKEFVEWCEKEAAAGRTHTRPVADFHSYKDTEHGYLWKFGYPCGCGCNKMENGMKPGEYARAMDRHY